MRLSIDDVTSKSCNLREGAESYIPLLPSDVSSVGESPCFASVDEISRRRELALGKTLVDGKDDGEEMLFKPLTDDCLSEWCLFAENMDDTGTVDSVEGETTNGSDSASGRRPSNTLSWSNGMISLEL